MENGAKNFTEHQEKKNKKQMFNVKTLVTLAMLATLAFVVTAAIRFIVPFPSAPFLQMDFKDIIIVIGGFIFGPIAAFVITVVVALIEFATVGTSGWVGLVMNIVSGTAFACTASFVYSKKRTMFGAIIGLLAGIIAMTIIMALWNYILTPIFMQMDRTFIAQNMIFQVFVPFNIFKGVVNSALVLLVYKPVVTGLRMARLMPKATKKDGEATGEKKKIFSPAIVAISLFVLLSSALWYMAQHEIGPFRSVDYVETYDYDDSDDDGIDE
ncbi:MAG: ECF transporter S component [Defluviitaleaceae bacterium]|nr:ECF transporter S component [Defluviitaleaceae bacterium]